MNKILSAHLETGRISNLPTVWSNVFMAFTIASAAGSYALLVLIAAAGSLFYVGGCYLGDAKDVEFDRINKPTRPIPSEVLCHTSIWVLGGLMMLGGMLGFYLASAGQPEAFLCGALPLAGVITAYAFLHKTTPLLGLPLIGCCRAFLIVAAYLAVEYSQPIAATGSSLSIVAVASAAGAMAIYTICFASVARLESSDRKIGAPQLLKVVMLLLPCAALLYKDSLTSNLILFSLCYIIYIVWLCVAFLDIHKNKGAYVAKCLAGFALLDMVLVSDTNFINAAICLVLFGFALMLQKIAPAT